MKRNSKSKPARKAAAKTAAKPKSTPSKTRGAKTAAKQAAADKSAVRKGAVAKGAQTKNIFAKAKKTTKSKAKRGPAAAKTDPHSVDRNAPLLDALDLAISEIQPSPIAVSGERRGKDHAGHAGNDHGSLPGRTNKLVPTNAVHTTKRRMKRNTWQSPVFALGAIAAILAILVLGNNTEPPDVSPLERRAEVRSSVPLPQAAKTPLRLQDPVQAAPDLKPRQPSRLAQPIMPRTGGVDTAPKIAQETETPRGLRVLELVEMERMLARLEMNPSQADGVVDGQTETAIRTYQQIAGLPVDGEATPELLDDMREVVKMMDGTN